MRAQLIPLDGGPPLELTKDLTLVGRKEDCDLRLDHKSVSKQHCVLVKSDGVLLRKAQPGTSGGLDPEHSADAGSGCAKNREIHRQSADGTRSKR